MQWDPNTDGLQQLVSVLRDSHSPDQAVQDRIQTTLAGYKKHPEYGRYLVYILTRCNRDEGVVRQVAGLLLKSLVAGTTEVDAQTLMYVKQEVVCNLGDPSHPIRSATASIVTSLVRRGGGMEAWPGLLEYLSGLLSHDNPLVVLGAFSTLRMLCEDHNRSIQRLPNRPLNKLITTFVAFFAHHEATLRTMAVQCVNYFMPDMPQAIKTNIDTLLSGLFALAADTTASVRREVCHSMNMLVDFKPHYIAPHLPKVIQFMMNSCRHPDADVALTACEFWHILAEQDSYADVLKPFLPQVLPLLLDGMVYSEEEIVDLLTDDDASIQDADKDIRPFFAKHRGGARGSSKEDDTASSGWTYRKCSAAGLDAVCELYGADILQLLLGLLQERLGEPRWQIRECSLLALGASAEGCIRGMVPLLPQMFEHLLKELDHQHPLVRTIAAWTLSRFSCWVARQPQTNESNPLGRMVQKLTSMLLDTSKNVQESVCTALASLEEACLDVSTTNVSLILPYLHHLVQHYMGAYRHYRAKNLLVLYDALSTLADTVGRKMNEPTIVPLVMTPLVEMWQHLVDNDRRLIPLMECLTSLAIALGPGFQPYAAPMYQRCLGLMRAYVAQRTVYAERVAQHGDDAGAVDDEEPPDVDFCIVSLDFISAMAQAFRQSVSGLLEGSDVWALVYECCQDSHPHVVTSSYAVIGDMTKHGPASLGPTLARFIPLLESSLFLTNVNVCCNASWALGELCAKMDPAAFGAHVPTVLARLIALLDRTDTEDFLLDNVTITIGRVGATCPKLVAPHLGSFLQPWCARVSDLEWEAEKDKCSRSLCILIPENPSAALPGLPAIGDLIVSWMNPSTELTTMFRTLLHWLKTNLGAQWPHYFETMSMPTQMYLSKVYGV